MFVLVARALQLFIWIIIIMIVARAILSWFPTALTRQIGGMIEGFISPILSPIRGIVRKSIFGTSSMSIDISPFIAYLILSTMANYLEYFIRINA